MITDPLFYAAAIPAVILVGLSKGGFGGSISMVGVPIMALAISPVTAAGVMLPILIVMDVVALLAWRGIYDRQVLRLILPASMLGIALGYATSAATSEEAVRLLLGGLCLVFAVQWFFSGRHKIEPEAASRPKGFFWGAVAGFTSFVSHAGGPPFQVYVMPLKLEPALFAGTTVIFFAATNFVKLIPYFLLGQFSSENLATSAVLLPLAPLATLVGVQLVKRVPRERFYLVTYSLLIPVGLKLVFDGIWHFAA
ncbi:sulfite exporter TauE/SafE family protein [Aureimonas leprariae]|uniref:Probable membrane transporter protein n=1 Tax=Plantimonas leprariae TaxID=2615207 RepID=A0A7V7PMT4_9HYPH|nr:sulfite exporter TauE/SafE family protein [Aureimonas leprariae]KAB0678750.1 sulfite exporter TauE/SafE family protein [Aureimonas leprariae]